MHISSIMSALRRDFDKTKYFFLKKMKNCQKNIVKGRKKTATSSK